MSIERVVILGGGQAGAQVAVSLRQSGFDGQVDLLSNEWQPPYQRPPLSKQVLTDETTIEKTYLRQLSYYAKNAINLHLGIQAKQILRDQRYVACGDQQGLYYDALVLCTGTRPRKLLLPGAELSGVFYLRTIEDAELLKRATRVGARAVIVGGGYIGLEVASSLRKLGCEVTLLERNNRVLNRVAPPPISQFFMAEHKRHGVKIVTNAQLEGFVGERRVEGVRITGGRTLAANLVIVGIGAIPNDELARQAGLATSNGIVVDAYGRASDPAVFAAGDVTNHPNGLYGRRIRLESVHNAMAQAKIVATAIAGEAEPYNEVPWFWSNQYDVKLQIAGLGAPEDDLIMRGEPDSANFSCLHVHKGRLIAIDAINRPDDFAAGKALIRERTRIDPDAAADVNYRLSDLRSGD